MYVSSHQYTGVYTNTLAYARRTETVSLRAGLETAARRGRERNSLRPPKSGMYCSRSMSRSTKFTVLE